MLLFCRASTSFTLTTARQLRGCAPATARVAPNAILPRALTQSSLSFSRSLLTRACAAQATTTIDPAHTRAIARTHIARPALHSARLFATAAAPPPPPSSSSSSSSSSSASAPGGQSTAPPTQPEVDPLDAPLELYSSSQFVVRALWLLTASQTVLAALCGPAVLLAADALPAGTAFLFGFVLPAWAVLQFIGFRYYSSRHVLRAVYYPATAELELYRLTAVGLVRPQRVPFSEITHRASSSGFLLLFLKRAPKFLTMRPSSRGLQKLDMLKTLCLQRFLQYIPTEPSRAPNTPPSGADLRAPLTDQEREKFDLSEFAEEQLTNPTGETPQSKPPSPPGSTFTAAAPSSSSTPSSPPPINVPPASPSDDAKKP